MMIYLQPDTSLFTREQEAQPWEVVNSSLQRSIGSKMYMMNKFHEFCAFFTSNHLSVCIQNKLVFSIFRHWALTISCYLKFEHNRSSQPILSTTPPNSGVDGSIQEEEKDFKRNFKKTKTKSYTPFFYVDIQKWFILQKLQKQSPKNDPKNDY